MEVNDYFGPRRTNRPHETPNYGYVKYKFEVDCYIQTYCSQDNLAHIIIKLEQEGQELMYSSKGFNYNYMEFVDYKTRDKLLWI